MANSGLQDAHSDCAQGEKRGCWHQSYALAATASRIREAATAVLPIESLVAASARAATISGSFQL